MRQQDTDEFENADTLVWLGPTVDLDSEDFDDEEVTGEFVRPADLPDLPPLPELDIDMGSVEDDADTAVVRHNGPPPIQVELLEPVFDPDLPEPHNEFEDDHITRPKVRDTIVE